MVEIVVVVDAAAHEQVEEVVEVGLLEAKDWFSRHRVVEEGHAGVLGIARNVNILGHRVDAHLVVWEVGANELRFTRGTLFQQHVALVFENWNLE